MANPFPGMDPFLERPSRWRGIHGRFINWLADTIDIALPANYSAEIDERIYVANPPKDLYPDVFVVKLAEKKRHQYGTSATAVLEATPFVEIECPAVEIREPFIEIRMADTPDEEPDTLIAVIEMLSPTNKLPGFGRKLYQEKQEHLLNSAIHLIEIDLLRAGPHTAAIPREGLPKDGWDYLVCLHRGAWQSKFRYWAFGLQERLPRITVPLAGKDSDVVVDLQAVLNQCHAAGKGRRIDYTKPCPSPPLSRKNAKWVDDLLRKKKLRK